MYEFSMTPHQVPEVETKHRKICTKLPVPESLPIIERLRKFEPYSMEDQLLAVWDKAVDYQIYDKWGNVWIDMSSGTAGRDYYTHYNYILIYLILS